MPYVPQALPYGVSLTLPVVANCEGRHEENLDSWAERTGRDEDFIEWGREQREKRRNNRQSKKKAEEEEMVHEVEQAEPGQSLAPGSRESDIWQKLYESFERFDRRILEEVFSRPWVS